MNAKNTLSEEDQFLREIITTRFSKEQIDGFQRLRQELFQNVATLPAVVRYCAIGGLKRELARLNKGRK